MRQIREEVMMRKTVFVLVGCLVLVTGPAWADGAFSLFGTYGQINDYTSSFGAGARFSIGGERLMGDLTATWFPSHNGVVARDGGMDVYDSLQVIPLELGIRWMFSPGSELRPYVGAGASFMLVSLSSGDADDEWGWYAMGGFAVFLWDDAGGFYLEAVYREADATLQYGSIAYEKSLGGLAGTAGFMWRF
jgi:hypothetical protein